MGQSDWGDRFLATTRGRIVTLLRRSPRTVNDLAADLELTDNAVRAHLATLERDGLVQQSGTRPGFRKPNLTYELTPDASQLFPKPYGVVLQQLLDVLGARLGEADLEAALRDVGRRIAALYKGEVTAAGVRERVTEAVAVLGELGGMAEVEVTAGGLVVRGFDCPLAAAVKGHPAGCRMAETLLCELTGVPVTERCQRGDPPRCAFEVPLPGGN
jgi:predicted ArsR family transcriptional regulator